ncbi:MAG TPA: hypothetical protein PKM73_03635, partial [Verrucomicrobiota bacterium]|nr:hypothetical protein [Verrucomicrobiota bacterium]
MLLLSAAGMASGGGGSQALSGPEEKILVTDPASERSAAAPLEYEPSTPAGGLFDSAGDDLEIETSIVPPDQSDGDLDGQKDPLSASHSSLTSPTVPAPDDAQTTDDPATPESEPEGGTTLQVTTGENGANDLNEAIPGDLPTVTGVRLEWANAATTILTETLRGAYGPPTWLGSDRSRRVGLAGGPPTELWARIQYELGLQNGGSFLLGDVPLGDFLSLTGVTLDFGSVVYSGGVYSSGTVGISVTSASLYDGKSFSASLTDGGDADALALVGTCDPGTTAFSLTADQFKLTVGEALEIQASGIVLSYDPNGAENQTLVSVGSATVTSPQFTGLGSATISALVIRKDGFYVGDATLTASGAAIGDFLSFSSVTVTASGFGVTYGTSPSVTGTITANLTGLSLFPNGGFAQVAADTVTASYQFAGFDGTNASGQLAIAVTGFALRMGEAVEIEAGSVTLTPGQTVLTTIDEATVTIIPLDNASLTITDLVLSQSGFQIGSATATLGDKNVGGFVTLTAPTLTALGVQFDYTTNALSGSLGMTTTGATLSLGGALSASVSDGDDEGALALELSYDLDTELLQLDVDQLYFNACGFVVVNASGVTLEKRVVDVDLDGDRVLGTTDLDDATLISASILGADIFIGVSGTGLHVTNGSLAFALIQPAATADLRSYLAVTASLDSASLEGASGLTATATGIELRVNRGTNSSGAIDPTAALNWTQAVDLGADAEATEGTGAAGDHFADVVNVGGVTISFVDDQEHATATVVLDVFGFVTLDGSFAFKKA